MIRKALDYSVLVVGGGHAGAEAAWAAANLLKPQGQRVALITMDPAKTGAMSCNPAIGGLAKGQMVREIDALGGLMGLAADATGIQFRMLNASRGPAVRGPRCQSDKYAYAEEVQRLLATRDNLDTIRGLAEDFLIEDGRCVGLTIRRDHDPGHPEETGDCCGEFCAIDDHDKAVQVRAEAVVLTTGTFMAALMHTGEAKTQGGRVGEGAAYGISGALTKLGLELGRLKTGTPPRLAYDSLQLDGLDVQPGDDPPVPFSELTDPKGGAFPKLPQQVCWITHTNEASHEAIRANLHRAPMYNGQIDTAGPRYCPSIEDKVVRFADRTSHHVFLEPESLRTDEIYCNGISTSLPQDVQEQIVRAMPGCEHASILKLGYAVEYDMVRPHQIDATTEVKSVPGLYLAGQINGTSGYEEAGAQGLLAGLNAARRALGEEPVRLARDEAYLGVLMDDLVTKTPIEPYRMFTSRAEHRLLLRSDNADGRLTPLGRELGLVDDERWASHEARAQARLAIEAHLRDTSHDEKKLIDWARQPNRTKAEVMETLEKTGLPQAALDPRAVENVLADVQYAGYVDRQRRDLDRLKQQEHQPLPTDLDYSAVPGLRKEAAQRLAHFKPATLGQAGRLEGVNPADIMLLSITLAKQSA